MLKVIIIDDELYARKTLISLIKKVSNNVHVIASADNVTEGYQLINKHKPDLIFLDIEMPRKNGFDLLNMFDKINFQVVFITAYDQYAIKAIKFSALDYILKPINTNELKDSILKAQNNKDTYDRIRIDSLLNTVGGNEKIKSIILQSRENYIKVNLSDIILLKGDGNYTVFFFKDKKTLLVSKTLKEYEDLLLENNFFRVHKSAIINLNCIVKYTKGDGGFVTMINDEVVKVSRYRKKEFIENYI